MAKLLYVDDEFPLVKVFTKKFEEEGYKVESASDGEEALTKVTEFMPDIILLDIKMPKLSGLEVLKKLKADEKTKHIPVIMLTNQSVEKVELDAAIGMGAVSYLVKADTPLSELTQKVKEVLGGYLKETSKMF